MTNEEHIEQLKKLRSFHNGSYGRSINKAIEALNQQTCEDRISREAVGNMLNRMQMKKDDTWYDYYQKALKELSELPPVYPKQKEGHWIRQTNDYHDYYECEHCGIAVGLDDIKNYCPNCGANMKGGADD